MKAATELQLSDEPATKPSEVSTRQTPQNLQSQRTVQHPTVTSQHSEDPMNPPDEYEIVDQHVDNHMKQSPDYEEVDQQGENREQLSSEYLTIPGTERPYDLPLTGYLNPATTTGQYSQLAHTYANQQGNSSE